VILETDMFSIAIDPAKGGRIRSLFAKDLGREFVDESSQRSFNEFRGYFGSEQKWLSSVDAPAEVRIIEQGPRRVAAGIHGRIGAWPFVTLVSAAVGGRRIDFRTTFELPIDSSPFGGRQRPQPGDVQAKRFRVGAPSDTGQATTRSIRRPFYDSSFKLQALFP